MILDTSFVVAVFERKAPSAVAALAGLGGPGVRSAIVEGELRAGVETATAEDLATRQRTLDGFLQVTTDAPARSTQTAQALAVAFGWLTALAKAERIKIGQNDRWILAEAAYASVCVLTADHPMNQLGIAAHESGRAGFPLTRLI